MGQSRDSFLGLSTCWIPITVCDSETEIMDARQNDTVLMRQNIMGDDFEKQPCVRTEHFSSAY